MSNEGLLVYNNTWIKVLFPVASSLAFAGAWSAQVCWRVLLLCVVIVTYYYCYCAYLLLVLLLLLLHHKWCGSVVMAGTEWELMMGGSTR